MQCGFDMTCSTAGITQLAFNVVNQTTNETKITTIPCPSGANNGTATIVMPGAPQSSGPWTITVTSPDKASVNSVMFCNVTIPCFLKLTGIEVYRALASANSPDQHRFIFCTGREPSELQPLVGNSRILTKPFRLEALRQAVQAVLERRE